MSTNNSERNRTVSFLLGIMLILPVTTCRAAIHLTSTAWRVTISTKTGAVRRISNPHDPYKMNWVRNAGNWGISILKQGGKAILLNHPETPAAAQPDGCKVIYKTTGFRLTVIRRINRHGEFAETYRLRNIGQSAVRLSTADWEIVVPFNDQYPNAFISETKRCNAHVWAGDNVTWINGVRMGGYPPNLGLVLTHGDIAAYSLTCFHGNRAPNSNDRGAIVLDTHGRLLQPNQAETVSWVLFWHKRMWRDFWPTARRTPQFVRFKASQYAIVRGAILKLEALGNGKLLAHASIWHDGKRVPALRGNGSLSASISTRSMRRSQVFTLRYDGGNATWLRVFVAPDPMRVIRRRVKFIIQHQQCNRPGPLDGAYLIYDNKTEKQIFGRRVDHNAQRERLAMGVLCAMYLPYCHDPVLHATILKSLDRYEKFIEREVQRPNGMVGDALGYVGTRWYDFPWVAQLHLAMYQATGRRKYLHLFEKTVIAYYRVGFQFYGIGMPVYDSLKLLKARGDIAEYKVCHALFARQAAAYLRNGVNFPESEVNYEQSIVAPAAQIPLDMYLISHKRRFLQGIGPILKCLKAFSGRQPDFHLYDIPIRHWDDYWFGQAGMNGDTMPQDWSTINAVVWYDYSLATNQPSFAAEAREVLLANLCLFFPDGSASCAYVYPRTIDGRAGRFYDRWANDQDWALVNLIMLKNRGLHLR